MLQSLYCLCFYLFTIEKVASFRGIVLTALFVGALQFYIHNEPELATAQLRLGKKTETINRYKFKTLSSIFRFAILQYVRPLLRCPTGHRPHCYQDKMYRISSIQPDPGNGDHDWVLEHVRPHHQGQLCHCS